MHVMNENNENVLHIAVVKYFFYFKSIFIFIRLFSIILLYQNFFFTILNNIVNFIYSSKYLKSYYKANFRQFYFFLKYFNIAL